jgi:hypothetical protein
MDFNGPEPLARISRRRLIGVASGLTAFAGADFAAGNALAATKKVAQTAAGYQPMPKGAAQCDKCRLWQPPAACQLVAGAISPSGWCNLYAPK